MREETDLRGTATVRVNLDCAGRRLEVAVATDWPVASLVPDLLRKVYGHQGAETAGRQSWGLGFPAGPPFGGVSTLGEHRVTSGAHLKLERVDSWQRVVTTQPKAPVPNGPGSWSPLGGAVPPTHESVTPSQRTDMILPEEPGPAYRLRSVFEAVFERPPDAVDERPAGPHDGVPVSPTRLTVPPRPSVTERVRVSWRETDYGNRLDRAIQSPQLRRCVTIALMSPKGGVGKTTLTALLGSMLAMTRRDRIVASGIQRKNSEVHFAIMRLLG